jgi:SGNH hydrolase-like domain, acetyltransferase AlgX
METETNTGGQQPSSWRLPRRDYVILPLLCLATILVMFGIAEGASRLMFAQHERDACMVHDPVLGTRFRPNCTSHVKAAEGPWVTNSYNACGYRTPQSCGPKPAGGVRVAVLGSSIAQGYLVPYQETFAARAAEELTRRCGEPVEFQNLASIGYVWERLALRADEALTLHPDAAIIVMIPFDLQQTDPGEGIGPAPKPAPEGPMKRLDSLMKNSRALVAAQHYLFSRPDLYTQFYLRYGDRADFLRVPLTPKWQRRVDEFDTLLGGIAAKYHAAHVPLLLVYVPQRAQATLLAAHQAPPGVAPYAFGRTIGEIAARHGVDYLDLSTAFSRIPQAASLYYPVDGHLTGKGDAVLAAQLAAALQRRLPEFAACTPPDIVVGAATP